jgi:tetratricopeptide (TPR) repeat protein
MEASALGNLGVAMAQSGEYKKALEALLRVLGIFRQIGDKASEANCLRNLAGLYQKMGQFRQAQGHCEQALAIAEELRIPLAEECKRLKEELKKEAG